MKRIVIGCVLGVLLAGMASASSLRIGGELLREGTRAGTVSRVLGEPEHRSVVWRDQQPDHEVWFYTVDGKNYEFRIRAGRVESIQWSRF